MGAAPDQLHSYTRGPCVNYTWSACLTFERPHTLDEVVLHKLGSLVTQFNDPEWPISGAVLGSGDAEDRTTLVLALDPSGSFGAPDKPRCEKIAAKITDTFGWQRQPEDLPEMRTMLGRRIGYGGAEYTVEKVRSLTVVHGCGNLALIEADLFSLRYVGGLREYHEPGVIVEGSADNLNAVLRIAAAMRQERLVTEITDIETQVWRQ